MSEDEYGEGGLTDDDDDEEDTPRGARRNARRQPQRRARHLSRDDLALDDVRNETVRHALHHDASSSSHSHSGPAGVGVNKSLQRWDSAEYFSADEDQRARLSPRSKGEAFDVPPGTATSRPLLPKPSALQVVVAAALSDADLDSTSQSPRSHALPKTYSLQDLAVARNPHETVKHAVLDKPTLKRWDSGEFYSSPVDVRERLESNDDAFFEAVAPLSATAAMGRTRRASSLSMSSSTPPPPQSATTSANRPNSTLRNASATRKSFLAELDERGSDASTSEDSHEEAPANNNNNNALHSAMSMQDLLVETHAPEPVKHAVLGKPSLRKWNSGDYFAAPPHIRERLASNDSDPFDVELRRTPSPHSLSHSHARSHSHSHEQPTSHLAQHGRLLLRQGLSAVSSVPTPPAGGRATPPTTATPALPDSVWTHVLAFLDLADLGRAASTCWMMELAVLRLWARRSFPLTPMSSTLLPRALRRSQRYESGPPNAFSRRRQAMEMHVLDSLGANPDRCTVRMLGLRAAAASSTGANLISVLPRVDLASRHGHINSYRDEDANEGDELILAGLRNAENELAGMGAFLVSPTSAPGRAADVLASFPHMNVACSASTLDGRILATFSTSMSANGHVRLWDVSGAIAHTQAARAARLEASGNVMVWKPGAQGTSSTSSSSSSSPSQANSFALIPTDDFRPRTSYTSPPCMAAGADYVSMAWGANLFTIDAATGSVSAHTHTDNVNIIQLVALPQTGVVLGLADGSICTWDRRAPRPTQLVGATSHAYNPVLTPRGVASFPLTATARGGIFSLLPNDHTKVFRAPTTGERPLSMIGVELGQGAPAIAAYDTLVSACVGATVRSWDVRVGRREIFDAGNASDAWNVSALGADSTKVWALTNRGGVRVARYGYTSVSDFADVARLPAAVVLHRPNVQWGNATIQVSPSEMAAAVPDGMDGVRVVFLRSTRRGFVAGDLYEPPLDPAEAERRARRARHNEAGDWARAAPAPAAAAATTTTTAREDQAARIAARQAARAQLAHRREVEKLESQTSRSRGRASKEHSRRHDDEDD